MNTNIRNICVFSILTLIIGLQCLFIIGFIQSFSPLNVDLKEKLLPAMMSLYKPEYDSLLYRVFIIICILLQGLGLILFRRQLECENFISNVKYFLFAELLWVSLLIFALYKWAVYGDIPLIKYSFYTILTASLISKIGWFKIQHVVKKLIHKLMATQNTKVWVRGIDVAICVFIIICIYIPDQSGAIAKIYGNDRFTHFDSFLMAPAWAVLNGIKLNVDMYSQYAVGLPIIIGNLTQFWGEFNYINVLKTIMLLGISYFILCYALIRLWLKNAILSAIGVILAIKFQFFFTDATDFFLWKYPSATVIRYIFDMTFFIFLWLHIQKAMTSYLLVAAALAGVSIFYMTDTGIYLTIAFYTYLLIMLVVPHLRKSFCPSIKAGAKISTAAILLPITVLLLYISVFGKEVLNPEFQKSHLEFINISLAGHGALPFHEGLIQKEYLAFFRGASIPLIYILTITIITSLICLKKIADHNIFAVILGVYGLCLYHYFVFRSAPFSYLPVSIPAVLIACYWFNQWLNTLKQPIRRNVLVVAMMGTVFAIGTTHAFIRYPNLLNLTHMSLQEEKQFMAEDLSIERDAAMIKKLTSIEKPVVLLSSFETAILIEAGRKPYFYFLPLFNSRFMKTKEFAGTKLFTKQHFIRTIQKLQEDKPEYIFFEDKLIAKKIPPQYYTYYTELNVLAQLVNNNYQPIQKGKYITAFKRKK